MYKHLDPIRPLVREQVSVMCTRLTEYLDHPCQRRVRSRSHVEGFRGHPLRINADQRMSSRSQTAQSRATEAGQTTITVAPERCH